MKEYRRSCSTLAVIEEITENSENKRLAPDIQNEVKCETEDNVHSENNKNIKSTCDAVDGHGDFDQNTCTKCVVGIGNDLGTLKEKATKLKLKTRRSSYVTWETEKLVRSGALLKAKLKIEAAKETQEDYVLTVERKNKINSDIGWIRKQLHDMRIVDQNLARKLLSLRHEIHSLKLKWSCDEHKLMMEEVKSDLEERQVLQDVCDEPLDPGDINPLKQLGVTRMNLSARRFSTC